MATAKPPGGDDYRFPDEEDPEKKAGEGGESAELEVEIVDDTPEADKGRKPLAKPPAEPTDEELEGYTEGVRKRINELTHARHDERRRAETLERERNEAIRVAQSLLEERKAIAKQYDAGATQFAETSKKAAEAELQQAKQALKAAHEAFDTDAIVEAQAAVASATLRLEQAKNFKPAPLQVAEVDVQPRQSQQQQQPPQLDDKTLNWQARNQWFGREGNEEHTAFAMGVHQKLLREGYDPRSDAYYEQIDARMKKTFPDLFGSADNRQAEEPSPKRSSTVVAPASRTTAAGKVRLTQSQVALAKRLGLTPQQYAAELVKESSNG